MHFKNVHDRDITVTSETKPLAQELHTLVALAIPVVSKVTNAYSLLVPCVQSYIRCPTNMRSGAFASTMHLLLY